MSAYQFGRSDMVPRICVLGVGDAGSTIVNLLAQQGSAAMRLVAVTTSTIPTIISDSVLLLFIGAQLHNRYGADGNPLVGKQAAIAARSRIIDVLHDIDVLIIVAGMGAGTGTGASVEIAKMASRLGIVVITVLSMPFRFEGKPRAKIAQEGLQAIAVLAHAQIVVHLDKTIVNQHHSIVEAFQHADGICAQYIDGIVDMLSNPGQRVLRVDDVRNLQGAGRALAMHIGSAPVTADLACAVQAAMTDALVDVDVATVRRVMIHVRIHASRTLVDVDNAVQRMTAQIPLGTPMRWGCSEVALANDAERVTILWNSAS